MDLSWSVLHPMYIILSKGRNLCDITHELRSVFRTIIFHFSTPWGLVLNVKIFLHICFFIRSRTRSEERGCSTCLQSNYIEIFNVKGRATIQSFISKARLKSTVIIGFQREHYCAQPIAPSHSRERHRMCRTQKASVRGRRAPSYCRWQALAAKLQGLRGTQGQFQ